MNFQRVERSVMVRWANRVAKEASENKMLNKMGLIFMEELLADTRDDKKLKRSTFGRM